MFVEIYGRDTCPYCTRAKQLAEKLQTELSDFSFHYTNIEVEGISKDDLSILVGKPVQTVPQIFIDKKPIGGCTDFQAFAKAEFGIEL